LVMQTIIGNFVPIGSTGEDSNALLNELRRANKGESTRRISYSEYLLRSKNSFARWIGKIFCKKLSEKLNKEFHERFNSWDKYQEELLRREMDYRNAYHAAREYATAEYRKLYCMRASLDPREHSPADIAKELGITAEGLRNILDEVEKEIEGAKPKTHFDSTKRYIVVCGGKKDLDEWVKKKSSQVRADISEIIIPVSGASDVELLPNKVIGGYFVTGRQYLDPKVFHDIIKAVHKLTKNEYY
jgi:hypothetical protein